MNTNDRCDRCNASAKVKVTMLNGELNFCGHHAKQFGPSLKKSALTIQDPEGLLHPAMASL